MRNPLITIFTILIYSIRFVINILKLHFTNHFYQKGYKANIPLTHLYSYTLHYL